MKLIVGGTFTRRREKRSPSRALTFGALANWQPKSRLSPALTIHRWNLTEDNKKIWSEHCWITSWRSSKASCKINNTNFVRKPSPMIYFPKYIQSNSPNLSLNEFKPCRNISHLSFPKKASTLTNCKASKRRNLLKAFLFRSLLKPYRNIILIL